MRESLEVKYAGVEPTRGSELAAAFDLYSCEDVEILPGEVKAVGTETFIEMDEDCEALLNVRSGLASKGIILANGTGIIDADYRGEIKLLLYNGNIKGLLFANILGITKGIKDRATENGDLDTSKIPGVYKINKGDRIGQLRVRQIPEVTFVEVDSLSETERGDGGFGSTGV